MDIKLSKDVIFGVMDEVDIQRDVAHFDYVGSGSMPCFGIVATHEQIRKFLIALSHDNSDSYMLAMNLCAPESDNWGRGRRMFFWNNLTVTG